MLVLTYRGSVLAFILVVSYVLCQEDEDICKIQNTNRYGTCKLISSCTSAINMLQTAQAVPQLCRFQGAQPIVCCADTPPVNILSQSDLTTPNVPTSPIVASTARTTITTVTPPITYATTPTLLQSRYSKVGDKSRAMCREYEKYVYYYPIAAGEPIRDCVLSSVQLIVGGEEAKLKEFPHMALIGIKNEDGVRMFCGGSLISERFVLTAAHCLKHPSLGLVNYVRIGDLDISNDDDEARPQEFSVIQWIKHPNYTLPSHYNDIALLKLDRDVVLNNYIRPACLETNTSLNVNIRFVATGWGKVGWGSTSSMTLLKVNLEYFTHRECYNAYKNAIGRRLSNGIDDATQVCAGSHTDSKDTCQGDSGGPLQVVDKERDCMYSIVGVTSFGKQCGIIDMPGVYTRVSNYVEWIENIVWP